MTENEAKETLKIMDIFKNSIVQIISIIVIIWSVFSLMILPIKQLEYSVGTILNNHLKTIQDEQITSNAEIKLQGEQLDQIQNQITELSTIVRLKK